MATVPAGYSLLLNDVKVTGTLKILSDSITTEARTP
jgi:hypothetical protein